MKPAQLLFAALLLCPSISFAAAPAGPEGAQFFEQKIRPVLVEHCYACHSEAAAENKKLKGGLLLDSSEGMLNGGDSGPSLVKGKPAESLIVKALKFDGVEMPPTGKLADDVVADFSKWIEMGAPDPRQGKKAGPVKREINVEEGRKHWAFQPLDTVTPPAVPKIPADTGPVDRFVLAAQIEHGIQPNTRVGKEKLIRRAYYDLIGLPPTPEQIDAFVHDESPEAFAKVVDALLASEHYGERWARHWLDVARYAESGGYEFDGFRPGAYHYRDWVIRALNRDMPYDEFVRMQLAGDKLLPNAYDGAAATGFLVAGPYPGQITVKTIERIRYDQLDDMIMTIGGSMLGLTMGCVRCHDHKFDPIAQTDYYSVAANLASTVQGARSYDRDPEATLKAQEKHRADREPLLAKIKEFAAGEFGKRFEAWQKNELPKQPEAARWQTLDAVEVSAGRAYFKRLPGGLVAYDGSVSPTSKVKVRRALQVPGAEEIQVDFDTFQKNITSLRIDLLTDKSLPARGPGLNPDGGFALSEVLVIASPLDPAAKDKPITLKLKDVYAAFADKDQPLSLAVDGKPETAWVVTTTAKKDNGAIFEIEGGLPGFASGTRLAFEFKFRNQGFGRFRLAIGTEPNPASWAGESTPQHLGELRAMLAANNNKLPPPLQAAAVHWFSAFDDEAGKLYRALRDHEDRVPRGDFTDVYTTIAGGQDVYLLRRGEVDNKAGKSPPGFIQVLSRGEQPAAEADPKAKPDPRIAFAQWMTDVEHGPGPLLARVMANRIWQHHFGEGLVGTPNDFGAQGEAPTHPELLEWLASELVREGWRLKPLHRAILLSEVYQQSEQVHPANAKADPTNRWLWHHRPQRLEAEVIRDALLTVGGTLDEKMYGPSILDDSPRRSIYLRVKRSELIPLMTMFDAPEPTQSIGERISTTVPTQALVLMNSPFVRKQAEQLAKRIQPKPDTSPAEAVDGAYRIALSRSPTADERQQMTAFIEVQQKSLGKDPQAALNQAIVEFCQVMLCLNEFVYVD